MGDYRDLHMYKKAFENAMLIFHLSKSFPPQERYGLTSQIRDSSRSVCTNIVEAYRKRRYPNHFVSKLTDSDMENSETIVWLEFAYACSYITKDEHVDMTARFEEEGRMLQHAIDHPEKFTIRR